MSDTTSFELLDKMLTHLSYFGLVNMFESIKIESGPNGHQSVEIKLRDRE
jgi:hypothetical protein